VIHQLILLGHEADARFRIARRVLNLVTERYLFPIRSEFFGIA